LWAGGRHLSDSGYVLVLVKGHPRCDSQGYVREHILIVEEAYGIEVTLEMEIHHKNKKRSDNRLENLVVCPDAAYHQALHVKEMALKTCGNPSYRKCRICGIWYNPDNMYVKGDKVRHNKCHSEYEKKRRAKKNKERRPLT
jgi:RecJ-like exonuclease